MRTSYHVGRSWMFDGKMLRAATGTPMRRIARAKSPFADAEPEPLTLANLTTKSLMRTAESISVLMMSVPQGRPKGLTAPPRGAASLLLCERGGPSVGCHRLRFGVMPVA